ncbi:MAG TPA: hypothetical protein VLA43_09535 [Longimicrobiales bacterium]|nr:hypothetical protein [Longimicrobiales bacterium]
MQPKRRELYRERTGWAPWVHLLLWGAVGGSAAAILLGTTDAADQTAPGRFLAALALLGAGVLIQLLFGGLTVVVEPDAVRAGLGNGWIFRTRIPLDDVSSMEAVTYSPLKEFGGWGLRGGSRKRAWTARGDRALVLTLQDGRKVYLGSDDPAKLESRIRMAMASGRAG